MNPHYKKILLLGSGGLRIGQAGEFDYSGSQAIKAFKQEGAHVVLVNPNIATVQTDTSMADTLYLEPLNTQTVTRIIEKEKPDAIALGFGGQTALNLALSLQENGILEKHNVAVLGTPITAIRITEDRDLFKQELEAISVDTPKSIAATTVEDALKAANTIGYPIMMRSGYSLGGLGSGKIANPTELKQKAAEALHAVPQILIEEYLTGWKELEYEIVRDKDDNCIVVCNMENLDPMGVHTGESIVVAPSQTLTNNEYHTLREIAIRVTRHIGIVGECNIQFALDPLSNSYRVIEMNARLSRSSALASKATGYPLAFVAAKLALGYRLDEVKNAVTGKTTAFFEPALDYLAVKIPRWDIQKFQDAETRIGTEMKSVGEVMAIGRSFTECIQKAVRMLNIGATGLHDYPFDITHPKQEIEFPTFRRLFALYKVFREGATVEEIHTLSHINSWFLSQLQSIALMHKKLEQTDLLNASMLRKAKQYGFADATIASATNTTTEDIRKKRIEANIVPVIKQIDTLAGEFPAQTNYLYLTYHGTTHDIETSKNSPVIIIGSGPYSIGSSVEFDWCAVNTARSLRAQGKQTIIVNSNPETVSTDYDESDRLYFDELTEERVRDIADFESPEGIIVSVGGQIANNLALPLHKQHYPILGTSPVDIDRAENRTTFSTLLETLGIDQPRWTEVSSVTQAEEFAQTVGYPVLVRPSYVLSGAAMRVIHSKNELDSMLEQASIVSKDHPVVLSEFLEYAKELEVDGVAQNGKILVQAMTEHVEHAGVHSGDATLVLPPQRLYLETIRRAKKLSKKIVAALNISGPFNIQFLARDNWLKIIECNVRSSRSFPFVSKVTNNNLIEIATNVFLGKEQKNTVFNTLDLDYVGVKSPQFSYSRIKGANPVANVEMASTGEVACIADDYMDAFMQSWHATEQTIKGKRLLLSIGEGKKIQLIDYLKKLEEKGWTFFATSGTHKYLEEHGVQSECRYKMSEEKNPNIRELIEQQEVDLIINIPSSKKVRTQTDGFHIRRLAIDHHIPLITNIQIMNSLLASLARDTKQSEIKSWQEYTTHISH